MQTEVTRPLSEQRLYILNVLPQSDTSLADRLGEIHQWLLDCMIYLASLVQY